MTSAGQSVALVPQGQADGMLATMLRRILAWLDSRALPAPPSPEEAKPVELLPEPEPVPEVTADGLMTPHGIAKAASNLLWAHRGAIEVTLDTDETVVDRQTHSTYWPEAAVRLPGGVRLRIPGPRFYGAVIAPDGQEQGFGNGNDTIMPTWRSIQVQAIIDTLGIEDLVAREPDDDGEIPHESHPRVLAEALGRYIEARAPVESTRTYRHKSYTAEREGKSDWKYVPVEVDEKSPWLELGEDILLRMVPKNSPSYSGNPAYEYVPESHVQVKHPVLGVISLPWDPIRNGLERRRLMSLSEALGAARELPRHLPMPRGNAHAAHILRLCREAVAAEPDLTDAAGTPIAPLVNQHLPELMRRHAAAAAIASVDQIAGIDADLAEGIERVRRVVEEALSCSAVARRSALKTQLGFLALRHPDPVPMLQSIATGDEA